jgi:hypothetical protein
MSLTRVIDSKYIPRNGTFMSQSAVQSLTTAIRSRRRSRRRRRRLGRLGGRLGHNSARLAGRRFCWRGNRSSSRRASRTASRRAARGSATGADVLAQNVLISDGNDTALGLLAGGCADTDETISVGWLGGRCSRLLAVFVRH